MLKRENLITFINLEQFIYRRGSLMYVLEFEIHSLEAGDIGIRIDVPSSELLRMLLNDLHSLFSVGKLVYNRNLVIVKLLSPDFVNRLEAFLRKWETSQKSILRLRKYFSNLNIGDVFAVMNPLSWEEYGSISNLLNVISILESYKKHRVYFWCHLKSFEDEAFACASKNYSFYSAGKPTIFSKKNIGESCKEKRVCRFCGRRYKPKEVTFEKEAHAISEALGNKYIFLNEECDTCNEYFSKTIEPAIIEYVNLFRVFYGVRGKKRIKEVRGKNFRLIPNHGSNGMELLVDDTAIIEYKEGIPTKLRLILNQKLIKQDVYKALCKFSLSIIDSKDLIYFRNTLRWIRGCVFYPQLPPIAVSITPAFFTNEPFILAFIRKTDDRKLPFAVGELHFTTMTFVYIIPTFDEDLECDFTYNMQNFKRFWECFFFSKAKAINWEFHDLSDYRSREFHIILTFQRRI